MTYGMPYMPSNGTEGMCFEAEFCSRCVHENPNPDKQPQCESVHLRALCGEQPPEWIYGIDGKPTCTKFKFWDWDENSEGEPEPIPEDPAQLCFPFILMELMGCDDLLVTKIAVIEKQAILN